MKGGGEAVMGQAPPPSPEKDSPVSRMGLVRKHVGRHKANNSWASTVALQGESVQMCPNCIANKNES